MTTTETISAMLGSLDELCKGAGPSTPIGSRYSMLCEMLKTARLPMTPRQQESIMKTFAAVNKQIIQIKADDGEYIPQHHLPRPDTDQ